jgi:hypothetical protein
MPPVIDAVPAERCGALQKIPPLQLRLREVRLIRPTDAGLQTGMP